MNGVEREWQAPDTERLVASLLVQRPHINGRKLQGVSAFRHRTFTQQSAKAFDGRQGCNGLVVYDVPWKWTGPTPKDMARTQEDARMSCISARE